MADSDSKERIAELLAELAITDKLLFARCAVIDLIPPCPIHGSQCLPHAEEWILERLSAFEEGRLDCQREHD